MHSCGTITGRFVTATMGDLLLLLELLKPEFIDLPV
jgi:hypothetical protein